jgi:CMP/dCMP kinase
MSELAKPRPARARRLVLAIDGPAASGKGTLARKLAQVYDLPHLDTGLLYRAVAQAVLRSGAPLSNSDVAARIATDLDLSNIKEDALRGKEMGEAASVVAAYPAVRAALFDKQRAFAAQGRGVVLDGRDIGTVICPDATAKLFVTASPEVRAARRHKELAGRGETTTYDTILIDIRRRDARDSGRADAPLKAADDAVMLDTSALTIKESLEAAIFIVDRARHRHR